jgi:hypothetical protein
MARKRLIKGANAARVEERIARVPADVTMPESSIFDALRALEGAAGSVPEASPHPAPPPPRAKKDKSPAVKSPRSRRAAAQRASAEAAPAPGVEPDPSTAPLPGKDAPIRTGRLGPSDFSAAEREAIVRCCSDYRNRLPTYLLAVQKEVKVIDSVIDKCQAAKGGK